MPRDKATFDRLDESYTLLCEALEKLVDIAGDGDCDPSVQGKLVQLTENLDELAGAVEDIRDLHDPDNDSGEEN